MPRPGLQDVLRVLRPMAAAIGTKRVVLVTDGTELLEQAAAYNGSDLWFSTTYDVKHAVDGGDCLRESEAGCVGGLTAEEIRYALLLDLEVLSKSCRYFMGTLRSSFTKTALLRGMGLGIIQHWGVSLD